MAAAAAAAADPAAGAGWLGGGGELALEERVAAVEALLVVGRSVAQFSSS